MDEKEITEEENDDEAESENHSELSTLDSDTQALINSVVNEKDPEKLKDLTELFNQNMLKKNIIRAIKNSNLLDDVTDVAEERIKLMGDSMSHRDIVEYMKVLNAQVQTAQDNINTIKNGPMIQPTVNSTTININGTELDRDSQDRVIDFIKTVLGASDEPEVIEAVEVKEDEQENS